MSSLGDWVWLRLKCPSPAGRSRAQVPAQEIPHPLQGGSSRGLDQNDVTWLDELMQSASHLRHVGELLHSFEPSLPGRTGQDRGHAADGQKTVDSQTGGELAYFAMGSVG